MTTYPIPASQSTALLKLSERECIRLLRSCALGRLAAAVEGPPRVLPIKYVLDGESVVFRTDDAMTLDAAIQGAVATLEVDNADPAFHAGWSVTITGELKVVTETDDLLRVRPLPLRAWGGSGGTWVRLRVLGISGGCVSP